MQGLFITFEGGEGAGKSTQIRQLESYLTSKGFDVVVTREPGGSPGAEAIRHVILSGGVEKNGPQLEALLFAAARIDHVERLIRPALQRGAIVLCDRFIDSTRAYQGTQGNLDPAFLEGLEKVAVGDTMPDLTIILDIMAEKGLERAALRRGTGGVDRFEREDITLHRKRRAAFLRIAEREPERCVVLDADRNPDLIAADVAAIVDTFITQKPRRKRKPYV